MNQKVTRRSLSVFLAFLALSIAFGGAFAAQQEFKARMKPDVIVPLPVNVDSKASGKAEFELEDGNTIEYKIRVKRIDHIFAAHVHQYVGDGANGPVMVWLYPDPAAPGPGEPTGPVKGELIEASFGPENLVNGFTWDQVLELLRTGQAYVNVHTTEAPAGEINGHIH